MFGKSPALFPIPACFGRFQMRETGRKSRLPPLRKRALAGAPPDADLGGAPAPAAPAADEPRDNLITKRPRRIVQPVRRHVLHPQHDAVTAGALQRRIVAGFHSARNSAREAQGEPRASHSAGRDRSDSREGCLGVLKAPFIAGEM